MRTFIVSSFCIAVLLAGRAGSAADATAAPSNKAAPSDKAPPSNEAAALFDLLDANHDGQLTAAEIPPEKRPLFERLLRLAGKPADGKLSRAEFIAQLKTTTEDHPSSTSSTAGTSTKPAAKPADKPADKSAGEKPADEKPVAEKPNPGLAAIDPEKVFDRLDTKHTGKLTLADIPEERTQLRRVFKLAGKADGESLTKEEFVKTFKEMLAKRAAAGTPPATTTAETKPATQSKPAADAKPAAAGNIDQYIARLLKMSKRSDGKLTKDDLPERIRDRFDKIDANHDGLIDETELRDWAAKLKRFQAAAQSK